MGSRLGVLGAFGATTVPGAAHATGPDATDSRTAAHSADQARGVLENGLCMRVSGGIIVMSGLPAHANPDTMRTPGCAAGSPYVRGAATEQPLTHLSAREGPAPRVRHR